MIWVRCMTYKKMDGSKLHVPVEGIAELLTNGVASKPTCLLQANCQGDQGGQGGREKAGRESLRKNWEREAQSSRPWASWLYCMKLGRTSCAASILLMSLDSRRGRSRARLTYG